LRFYLIRFFFDDEQSLKSPVADPPHQKLTVQAHSAMRSVMTTTRLDFSGLSCPLPALKTRKALKQLASGDRLEITCTDPLAAIDIPNLVRTTGDLIERIDNTGDTIVFVILRRREGP
jgi:tRNA 2-thiouridine synthesizing protein A